MDPGMMRNLNARDEREKWEKQREHRPLRFSASSLSSVERYNNNQDDNRNGNGSLGPYKTIFNFSTHRRHSPFK